MLMILKLVFMDFARNPLISFVNALCTCIEFFWLYSALSAKQTVEVAPLQLIQPLKVSFILKKNMVLYVVSRSTDSSSLP